MLGQACSLQRQAQLKLEPRRSLRCTTPAAARNKLFRPQHNLIGGPLRAFRVTQEHSDGDSDFYKMTSRLADQFDWFGPTAPETQPEEPPEEMPDLCHKELAALGLIGQRRDTPDPKTLSFKHAVCGPKNSADLLGYTPSKFMEPQLSVSAQKMRATAPTIGDVYESPRAEKTYNTPEGRAVYWPESERYGDPPDLPSLLLANRVIYIAMPFVPQVTELIVAQCVYLEGDEKNRNVPIYVYLNSTGCHNEQGQALASDYEFFAMWAALGFTRAPIYTGTIGYARNAAGILLSSGVKGHRYAWPHASISITPPTLNRVFGDSVDAQIQSNQLKHITRMYASILSKGLGKDPQTCMSEYLTRRRYFDVKGAIEEGIMDKVLPGHMVSPRIRELSARFLEKKMEGKYGKPSSKPQFRFRRDQQQR